ncbi:hypothetical protein BLIC30S_01838 [Bacillus licheniformis]
METPRTSHSTAAPMTMERVVGEGVDQHRPHVLLGAERVAEAGHRAVDGVATARVVPADEDAGDEVPELNQDRLVQAQLLTDALNGSRIRLLADEHRGRVAAGHLGDEEEDAERHERDDEQHHDDCEEPSDYVCKHAVGRSAAGGPDRVPRPAAWPSPALRTWRRVVRGWSGSDYLTTPSDA